MPITDPTEIVYALTAKEMLAAGDWLSPRIYGNFWFDKPPMFYWELLVAYKIFGVNEFAARFFPTVFATAGLFITYFFAEKIYNAKVALVAAVLLATSLEYWYIAHAIITDMTLQLFFAATLITFFLGYRNNKPQLYVVSFAASALAVLTKGPIGFFLPGIIILLFLLWQHDLTHLKKIFRPLNLLVLVVIVASWYLPMMMIHGSDFLVNFLGVHNLLRATVSEYPKTDVWYYYSLVTLVGFLPWSLVAIGAALKKIVQRRLPTAPTFQPHEKFLFVWAATVIVFFQLCATKYVTYTLPAMIPLAIFVARFFDNRTKLFRGIALGAVIGFPILLAVVAYPLANNNSARLESEIVAPLLDENTCLVSHGKEYPASLSFYTGHEVLRLETPENFALIRPKDMKWSSKNVMPFMLFSELPADKKVVAVVSAAYEKSFLDNASGKWKRVGQVAQSNFQAAAANLFTGRANQQVKSIVFVRE